MRWALGIGSAGIVAAISYVGQRLLAGDADPSILAQESVPFYWRVGVAVLQGVIAGSVVGLGARDPEWALARLPLVVGVVAPILVVAALAVP